MEDVSDPNAWNQRYLEGSTGWDLKAPAVALSQLLAGFPRAKKRVFVPGAGFGNDAIAWAQAGHDVVAADFAPLAVAGMKERAEKSKVQLTALQADIFALDASLDGSFDIVWEQTCLCAIDPARRPAYVDAMHRMLKPGGTMYALLWNRKVEGGPPYDLPRALTHALFAARFDILRVDTVHGTPRAGEYLMTLKKRA